MAKNRAKAEEFILKYIGKLSPRSNNQNIYKELFSSMSDEQFDQFMTDLETGKKFLVLLEANYVDTGLSVSNNLEVAKELGHDFFERLWIEGKDNMPTYLTPVKYMVVDLPIRRASQLLTKKISVPDHNKVVDTLSGQPTGESKGAKISYPELQVCAAMGLENSMVELMKYRGGDIKGGAALNNMLSKLGTANMSTLSNYASGVESTKVLRTFLNCMMLRVNI